MATIITEDEFLNIKDTLECGQIFRFRPFGKGYLVFSTDKACYSYGENGRTFIECPDEDEEYFRRFFDLDRDYSQVYDRAEKSGYEIVRSAATAGRGIRILNQDKNETLFSFLVSQNNRIPRINPSSNAHATPEATKRRFRAKNI